MVTKMDLLNQGYYLKVGDQGKASHVLGGRCDLDGATSPNSGRPLTQMARLDTTSEELLPLSFPFQYLPLLYGWSCSISEGPLHYRLKGNSIELVWFTEGTAYDDFPYESYPGVFPEIPVHAIKLTDDEQAAINRANSHGINFSTLSSDLDRILKPNHQIGGSPYVGAEIKRQYECRHCGGKVNFVAAIGNDCVSDPRGFMGNDYAQLLYFVCEACLLICAENICD